MTDHQMTGHHASFCPHTYSRIFSGANRTACHSTSPHLVPSKAALYPLLHSLASHVMRTPTWLSAQQEDLRLAPWRLPHSAASQAALAAFCSGNCTAAGPDASIQQSRPPTDHIPDILACRLAGLKGMLHCRVVQSHMLVRPGGQPGRWLFLLRGSGESNYSGLLRPRAKHPQQPMQRCSSTAHPAVCPGQQVRRVLHLRALLQPDVQERIHVRHIRLLLQGNNENRVWLRWHFSGHWPCINCYTATAVEVMML
jgi:hypothetical protein